jgi:predicted transcriptional regulator
MTPTILRIEYATEEEKERKLVAMLNAMGFVCTKTALEAVTVGELARQCGRPVQSVSRALHRYGLENFKHEAGHGKTRKRILRLWPDPNLLAKLH